MKCDDCGEEKEEVKETTCPYASEIHDSVIPCKLCNDCYHDAVQIVVDGLDGDGINLYLEELGVSMVDKAIVEGEFTQSDVDSMDVMKLASEVVRLMCKATTKQKCEAILKAKGLWE